MRLGEYLSLNNIINRAQLKEALSKQSHASVNFKQEIPLGKIFIKLGFASVAEVAEALNSQSKGVEVIRESVSSNTFTLDKKLTLLIGLWIIDKIIMLIMLIYLK